MVLFCILIEEPTNMTRSIYDDPSPFFFATILILDQLRIACLSLFAVPAHKNEFRITIFYSSSSFPFVLDHRLFCIPINDRSQIIHISSPCCQTIGHKWIMKHSLLKFRTLVCIFIGETKNRPESTHFYCILSTLYICTFE